MPIHDCHIQVSRLLLCRRPYRAEIIRTDTGAIVFSTWPYSSEAAARRRAARWMDEELQRQRRQMDLFYPSTSPSMENP